MQRPTFPLDGCGPLLDTGEIRASKREIRGRRNSAAAFQRWEIAPTATIPSLNGLADLFSPQSDGD